MQSDLLRRAYDLLAGYQCRLHGIRPSQDATKRDVEAWLAEASKQLGGEHD